MRRSCAGTLREHAFKAMATVLTAFAALLGAHPRGAIAEDVDAMQHVAVPVQFVEGVAVLRLDLYHLSPDVRNREREVSLVRTTDNTK